MFPLLDTTFEFCLGVPESLSLFDKLIQPILLYGSEIWGALSHHQVKFISKDPNLFCKYMIDSTIEKSKLKFSKSILGLKRNTPSLAVYGELGTIPTALTGRLQVIKFWHRVSQKEDNALVNKALGETTSLSDNSNWLNTVKTVINLLDLSSIWNKPFSFSSNQVSSRLKEKATSLFKGFWLSELSIAKKDSIRNSKLRTYKTFKSNLKLESYLTQNLCFEKRQALCKFRCSDHTLLIEVGRHKGLAVEERKCEMCTLGLVEDEVHFLITCPAYDS